MQPTGNNGTNEYCCMSDVYTYKQKKAATVREDSMYVCSIHTHTQEFSKAEAVTFMMV